eukprot:334873-Pyramimonas_sp.AAC.1
MISRAAGPGIAVQCTPWSCSCNFNFKRHWSPPAATSGGGVPWITPPSARPLFAPSGPTSAPA